MISNVIVALHDKAHLPEQLRVARILCSSGKYRPVMVFCYYDSGPEAAVCVREGLDCYAAFGWDLTHLESSPSTAESVPNAPPADVPRYTPPAWKELARKRLGRWYQFAGDVIHCRRALRLAREVVAAVKAELVVLAEDNVGCHTAALIRAAHDAGKPAVLVPFTVCNAAEPAEAYYDNPDYSTRKFLNRLYAYFRPRWAHEHRGRRMVRLPAGQALVMDWFGLTPPRPWIMNSGYADAIAVESEAMREYALAAGLPAERLRVVGAAADDVLAENLKNRDALRAELCRRLHWPPHRPLILCALPPDQFNAGRLLDEFSDHRELAAFWLKTLAAQTTHHVVVRPHPRQQNIEDLRRHETDNLRLVMDDTAGLVPLCDIFVASVSATIRWAIACGLPVVNYDVYQYRYDDYRSAGGVLYAACKAEFAESLRRLSSSPEFYAETAARQRACRERWGKLDGQTGRRLTALFDELIAKRAALGPRKGTATKPEEQA